MGLGNFKRYRPFPKTSLFSKQDRGVEDPTPWPVILSKKYCRRQADKHTGDNTTQTHRKDYHPNNHMAS